MPIRVVIAEDHNLVREGTRSMLKRAGDIEIVGEAVNGFEAVQIVDKTCPDVVIMDIAMPGLNGVEATRRIKEAHPSIAVLVLTAYDDDAYVFALLEAGAAGYLMKTVQGGELVEAIRAVHKGESVLSPAVARKVLGRFVRKPAIRPGNDNAISLTEREKEVLTLAARGFANKEIASTLSLSPRTVQVHLAHAFGKLGVASRTEAVAVCLRHGLLSDADLE